MQIESVQKLCRKGDWNELCFVRYADSRSSHYYGRVVNGICWLKYASLDNREVCIDGRSIIVSIGIYQCDDGL